MSWRASVVAIVILCPLLVLAETREICTYQTSSGQVKHVDTLSRVPVTYRATTICQPVVTGQYLAAPDEVELGASKRKTSLSSALGRIELTWPREVERLFGRSPERAVIDAAYSVSRALKSAAFPPRVRIFDREWKIVFMDEKLPETQIPQGLVSSCHPAWMTPPTNVYVVAQRVAEGCGGSDRAVEKSVADAQLAQVLIHEMGHAVEAMLLEDKFGGDRMRAEGFASWFEQYAADFSGVIPRGTVSAYYRKLAAQNLSQYPGDFVFDGSAASYARASMIFAAVVDRRGVGGLMDLYDALRVPGADLTSAMQQGIGWNQKRLEQEVRRLLE